MIWVEPGLKVSTLNPSSSASMRLPSAMTTTDALNTASKLLTFTQFFAEPNKLSLKDCPVLLLFTNVTFPAII
jgi:hypothetical protein